MTTKFTTNVLAPGDRRVYIIGLYMYVAVVGDAGNWTVFEGPTGWGEEKVVSNGDKVARNHSQLLFPELVKAGLLWRS